MAGTYVQYPASGGGGSATGSQTGVAYTVGPLDGAALNDNGGTIGSFSLYLQSATATRPGLVSSANQTFAGVKTFNSAPIFDSLTASLPVRLDGSKALINGSISLTSEVSGNLPLSQTSGSVSLVNQVTGNLPLSQTSGSISLTTQVSGILPVAFGGTNSGSALSGNRVIVSSAGALVELSALAGSAPVRTDSGGMLTVGSISLASDVSGSISLTNISGAIGTSTIANSNYAQVWNWNTLTTETAINFATTSLTSGTLFKLSTSNNPSAVAGTLLSLASTATTNGNTLLDISQAGGGGSAVDTVRIHVSKNNFSGNTINVRNNSSVSGAATGVNIDMYNATGTSGPIVGLAVQTATVQNGVAISATNNSVSGANTINATSAGITGAQVTVNMVNASTDAAAYAFDASGTGTGTKDVARIKNVVTAANNSAAQLLFAANRTTGGLTSVSGIAGMITDITNGAYTGALILSTAHNAAPVERMRLDHLGKLSLTGSGSFEAAKATIGSITHTSSTSGATYSLVWPGAQGSAGQTISNDGSGNLSWAAASGMTNPMTTLGDIIVGSTGGEAGRLAIGSTGYTLVSNPSSPTVVAWQNETSPTDLKNVGLSVAIAGGTLKIGLTAQDGTGLSTTNPAVITFRHTQNTSQDTFRRMVVGSAIMTLSAGSNLGILNSTTARIWVYAYDNVGAVGLCASAARQDESVINSFSYESATATYDGGSDIWSTVSGGISNNSALSLTTTGQLPEGYEPNVRYYVINVGTTSFQLSSNPNSVPVPSTGSGSAGVHTWHAQHPGLVTSSSSATGLPIRLLGSIKVTPPIAVNGSFTSVSLISVGGENQPEDDISMRYSNVSTPIDNTEQKFIFPQKHYDTHNCYAFGHYIAPVTGKYQVFAKYRVNGGFAVNSVARVSITVNSGSAMISQNFNQTGGAQGSADVWINDTIYLNAFDLVTIKGSTDATTPNIGSTSAYSYMSIAKV